ncbi:MAG: hypothetical protein WDA20_13115 [Desulfuromonadales bacterium]
MPLELVTAPDHNRNRSLGWLAVAWMEWFCLYGPGDIQGTPLRPGLAGAIPLADELTVYTVDVYALDARGRRLYDSAFYSRPKGADKSGHASRIMLFEALGPCRFAGWAKGGEVYEWLDFRYVYRPGEPMGRRITYPFLRILATEESQAGNVYDSMYFNLDDGPLREAFRRKDDVGLTRVYLPDGGEIRPSTASNAAKDGGLETAVSFDETHLYDKPELRRMYATVRRNLTKRKEAEPWSNETSTMYSPGANSIAEQSHELAQSIRDGKVKRSRLYFNHRQAPANVDLADEASLRGGLIEAYGDAASYLDLDRKVDEVWDPRNNVDDSRRFFLNQVTAHSEAWVTPQEWDAIAWPWVPVAKSLVTLGLDGSQSDDHTALIGCDVETGHLFRVDIWDPADHGGEVPREDVDATVAQAFERWDVVGFYSDVQFWESYIDKWEVEYGDKLCAKSTVRHPIAWDMRGKATDEDDMLGGQKAVVRAVESLHAAIVESARMVTEADDVEALLASGELPVTHDGDRWFRTHVVNARRRPSRWGVSFGKSHKGSPDKVDSTAAATLARQCRQDYLALPEGKRRKAAKKAARFYAFSSTGGGREDD